MNSILLLVSLGYLATLYHQAVCAPASLLTCEQKLEKIRNSNPRRILQWLPDCTDVKPTARAVVFFGDLPENETEARPAFFSDRKTNRIIPLKPGKTERETKDVPLPESYSTRDTYRSKCPGVDHVYKQTCANCWAVASIGMINDRVCIYGKDGVKQSFFSINQMTSCVELGCNGSYVSKALGYWKSNGITTGGNPDLKEEPGCLSWPKGGFPHDGTILGTQCPATCDDGSNIETKSYGSEFYTITHNETAIMTEIYHYGPVISGMITVYEDLKEYRSGVYKRVYGERIDLHAVKIIGWGVENGVKYWLIHNSWGQDWGENGFFKIERGTDEVGIEAIIEAAVPRDTGLESW